MAVRYAVDLTDTITDLDHRDGHPMPFEAIA
jgi:hypothetical protein